MYFEHNLDHMYFEYMACACMCLAPATFAGKPHSLACLAFAPVHTNLPSQCGLPFGIQHGCRDKTHAEFRKLWHVSFDQGQSLAREGHTVGDPLRAFEAGKELLCLDARGAVYLVPVLLYVYEEVQLGP